MNIKIALTGVAGAGKGLVASILYNHYKDVTVGSFAAPIKRFVGLLCQMTDQHLYGELKEIPLTFIITPESFNQAAEFYLDSGLDDYISFDRMWTKFLEVFEHHIVGVNVEGLWGMQGISSRKIQQLFGTEVMRSFMDDIWIKLLLDSKVNIVDDLRFLNEEKALRYKGYVIVQVLGKESRIEDTEAKAHISETEQSSIVPDLIIDNYFDKYTEQSKIDLTNRMKGLGLLV